MPSFSVGLLLCACMFVAALVCVYMLSSNNLCGVFTFSLSKQDGKGSDWPAATVSFRIKSEDGG